MKDISPLCTDCGKNYEINFNAFGGYVAIKDGSSRRYLFVRGETAKVLTSADAERRTALCHQLFNRLEPKQSRWYNEKLIDLLPSSAAPILPRRKFPPLAVMVDSMLLALALGFVARLVSKEVESQLWLVLIWVMASIVIHEAAHAAACLGEGRAVNGIGIKLNYGFPMFYVNTSDICMAPLTSRTKVSLAGAYSNALQLALLSLVAIIAGCYPTALMDVSLAFVLGNLIPFCRLDGYYIISDYWEETNLNREASKALIQWLRTHRCRSIKMLLYALCRDVFIAATVVAVFNRLGTLLLVG